MPTPDDIDEPFGNAHRPQIRWVINTTVNNVLGLLGSDKLSICGKRAYCFASGVLFATVDSTVIHRLAFEKATRSAIAVSAYPLKGQRGNPERSAIDLGKQHNSRKCRARYAGLISPLGVEDITRKASRFQRDRLRRRRLDKGSRCYRKSSRREYHHSLARRLVLELYPVVSVLRLMAIT